MSIYSAFAERFLAAGVSVLLVISSIGLSSKNKVTGSPVYETTLSGSISFIAQWILLIVLRLIVFDIPLAVGAEYSLGGLQFDERSQAFKVLMVLATLGCLTVPFGVGRSYRVEPFGNSTARGGRSPASTKAQIRSAPDRNQGAGPHSVILMLFALLGGRLLVSSEDLRLFYLALELQSLALYALAGIARGSAYSTEAGLKYFRLGAFASGLYLLGGSLVYGYLGTTSYSDIGRLLSFDLLPGVSGGPVGVGFALMVAAIMFKLAAVPFHRWSPDVIEGSPVTSSRFFATVTKVAAFGALIRFVYGPFHELWCTNERLSAIAIRSGLSMIVAALAALGQRRRKRFLAYSGIGHVGFMLMGLASGTTEGLQAAITYLSIYVVGSVGLWGAVASSGTQYFTDLGGLARRQPALAAVFAVSRFSRAGVPPRAGFFAKLSVFFGAMESSSFGLVTLAIMASVVGAFYYLRLIKIRYFETANGLTSKGIILNYGAAWAITLSTFITLFILVDTSLLNSIIQSMFI